VHIGLISFAQTTYKIPPQFVKRKGSQLVVGIKDSAVHLQGMSFTNWVHTNVELPVTHHNEEDFKRLAQSGMNVVRFYMNYLTFETDEKPYTYKKEGFDWIDKNIQWAKKHGVYLILNMHVPQGGFQSGCQGEALWNDRENQSRLKALYKVLANRYINEPTVLGYDLVNEPVVTQSIDQWKKLAQELTDEIRRVDRNHLIIAERLNAINCHWDNDENNNLFLINDENTLYTFHFYSPIEYTHQNASWTSFGDGGKYPDEHILQFPSDTKWYSCINSNPKIPAGNSSWKFYEGIKYTVNDTNIICSKPACLARNIGEGKAYYDDFIIKEYDETGKFIRDIYKVNITTRDGWWFWSANDKGSSNIASTGHDDDLSLELSQTDADANASSNTYRFKVTQGYSYSISGWMKGEQIPAGAECRYRLDFETSPSHGIVTHRDKEYLELEVNKFLAFGKKHNVPMYCGEFGVINNCFKDDKGGLNWVSDILDIFTKYNVHYTYHAYHEDAFGLYYGYNTPIDHNNGNMPLIKLFKTKLTGKP